MRRLAPKGVLILAALAMPLVFNEAFYQHIMIAAVINIILAVSLGIILGYIGELSLAHGAFYGIGAYTSALLMVKVGLPFVLAFPLSVVSAGIMGFIIGIPALRLSGHYFAIATLGFQGIVVLLIINLVDLTRGPMGLPGIPSPGTLDLFGWSISFGDKLPFFYLAFAVMIVVLILVRNLLRYKFGEAFIATREDSLLAASLGVQPRNCRMLAFVISTALAGAAGSLYAHYTMFISPDSFTLSESIYLVTMVIIGGRGTIVGPLIGAVILTGLPEVLRFAGDLQFVIYGLMLMMVVIFLPKGIVGFVDQFKQRGAPLGN
ncbi:MAG: branched-chain amino acid ABC transporter permease [Proteobacteria bacterium]|nr:branched-chain amino acid ABC transporter permease [Pseudomonadota bacterium]MBU4385094.1 branched-chain amino acid ABC transporter permease [Pseudomonadota bacterium]MCG2763216.1 branched-chain amino acid ABC transporter permease [Desulfarculaceae bacterium]